MGITSLGAYSPLGYELTFLTEWHCQLLRAYYHNHIRQNNNRKSICKRAISLGLWYECVEKYHNIFTLLYMLEICNSFEKIYIIKIGIYFSRPLILSYHNSMLHLILLCDSKNCCRNVMNCLHIYVYG